MAEDTKANVFALEASISINTTNFIKDIEHLKIKVREFKKSMQESNSSVQSLQRLINNFSTQKMRDELDGLGDKSKDSKEKVEDLGDSAEDSAEKSKTAFGSLKDSVKATFNEMGDSFKMTSGSLQSSISATATNFGKITAAVESVINAIKKIGDVAVKSFKIAVEAGKEFTESITDVVKKSNDIENTISLAFGGAGLAVGGASFAVGKDFESSMANVIAIMGATKDSVTDDGVNIYDMLESAAKEAGATTMFTAKESADALGYLAQMGYKAEDAINTLPTVLAVAKAGGMDLAYTAKQLAISMNVLGKDGGYSVEYLGDVLTTAANNSGTSIQELMEAFTVVGGQANAAKVPLEDTVKLLGVLANAGYTGSQGGTLARNIIKNLYTPTEKALKQMAALGLNPKNADGTIKSIQAFVSDMMNVMGGLDDYEQLDLFSELFDVRNISGAYALLNDTETWDKLTNAIDECAGATERMGETYSDTVNGDIVSMTSRLQSVGLAIYDYIEKPIRDAVQESTDYLTRLQQSIDEYGIPKGAFSIGDIVDESLEKNTPSVLEYMEKAGWTVESFIRGFFDNIPDISENISSIIQKFGEVRDKIFNSIIMVFSKDENSTGLINIGETILDTMLATAENVTGTLAEKLPQFIEKIADSLTENKDDWTKSITAIIKNISDLIVNSAPALVEIGGTLLVAIVQGMATTTTEITKILPSILEEFTKLLSNKEFYENLRNSIAQIIRDLGDIAVIFVKFLAEPSNIQFVLDIIENILGEIINVLYDITPELMAAAKPIAEKLTIFFNEVFLPFIVSLNGIGTSIGGAFMSGIWSGIVNSKFMGILPSLSEIFSKDGIIDNGLAEFEDTYMQGWDVISDSGRKLLGLSPDIETPETSNEDLPSIYTPFQSSQDNNLLATDNNGFVKGLNTNMANLVGQMDFSWAADIGYKLVTKISEGISGAWDGVKETVKKVFSFLDFSDEIESAKEWGHDFVMNLSSNAIHTFSTWKSSLENVFNFFDLSDLADKAKTWGLDMMQNFIQGIKDKAKELNITVTGIAGFIVDNWGFSEPKEGPLSNFHTFAPDMIDLFASGIRNNASQIYSEVDNLADSIKSGLTNIGISQPLNYEINENTVKPDLENIIPEILKVKYEIDESTLKLNSENVIPEIPKVKYEYDDMGEYVSNNIKSTPVRNNSPNISPSIVIESLSVNVEGTNIESDYDVDRMVDRIIDGMSDRAIEKFSERLKMHGIFSERALGGAAWQT